MSRDVNANLFSLLQNDVRKTFFVAEAGLNHGGSRERALAMVRAAKWAGADAIKFRMFGSAGLTANHFQPVDARGTVLAAALKECELDFDAFQALCKEARRLEIQLLSTPEDKEGADLLSELGIGAFHIGSNNVANAMLIQHVAKKGRPILLSVGASPAGEIEQAIDRIYMQGNHQIILLHSMSVRPEPSEMNLRSIKSLRERFGVPIGLSDYSDSNLGAIIALSLGAQVVERHFMLDTRGSVPHREVSFDTKQLRAHIEELRATAEMLGDEVVGRVALGSIEANDSVQWESIELGRTA